MEREKDNSPSFFEEKRPHHSIKGFSYNVFLISGCCYAKCSWERATRYLWMVISKIMFCFRAAVNCHSFLYVSCNLLFLHMLSFSQGFDPHLFWDQYQDYSWLQFIWDQYQESVDDIKGFNNGQLIFCMSLNVLNMLYDTGNSKPFLQMKIWWTSKRKTARCIVVWWIFIPFFSSPFGSSEGSLFVSSKLIISME